MTNLSYLNLSNNHFDSSVPVEFKNLFFLTDLDLHSNSLSGNLNALFEKSSQYTLGMYSSIDLSNNIFSLPIDEDIGNKPVMKYVETLILSGNPLGGKIPTSLGKLRYLRKLEMEKNRLVGGIPMEVLNLKYLKSFNVSYNRLSGKIPAHKVHIPASAFEGNAGLCGEPLPPCKK
ncbi:LRR receptor-like serine/threonine-protein kinase GSO2 [Striga hermonthica]|uniref:LRR receptor-like serine/threonine-protein kinase GSO2 n=1 Tax=Striga hermonthica TaxID=68872 RepID=A0A9N7RQ38_STRHE|nr:LRR receptor-like serine/threonine-protein kinase GSO2 [Striga hermonthica]